jgi:hypothetical protein
MVCRSCGLDNDPYATFCARCNATLAAEATQPQFSPPAPPAPGPAPFPPTRRRPLMVPVLAASVILLIAAGVLFVRAGKPDNPVAGPATTTTTTTPTTEAAATSPAPGPTTRPQDQAEVFDELLDRSAASRAKLNQAIENVNRCTRLDAALAGMRAVGDERTQQIAAVDAADVSALTDGETLRSTLKSALSSALAADREFVAWAAPAVSNGCGNTTARKAAWSRGQAASKKAQAAKKQFVAAWNPVAVPLGFESRTTQYI